MGFLINELKRLFLLGSRPNFNRRVKQQILVSNFFALFGCVVTFVFGVTSLLRPADSPSYFLFAASALFALSYLLRLFPSIVNYHFFSKYVLLSILLTLMTYLLYSGGYANTGPLWIYVVPPVVFFLFGLTSGAIIMACIVVGLVCMLFLFNEQLLIADYPLPFKKRLFCSFLSVSLLFAMYEFARIDSYRYIARMSNQYQQQAMQDALTSIENRRAMNVHLKQEYSRAQRLNTPLTIMICDIDHFKNINDRYLHDAGDSVLKQIAQELQASIRNYDRVARWGGEEFLFLLPNTTLEEGVKIAEKIRIMVSKTAFLFGEHEIYLSVSFGVSQMRKNEPIEATINEADRLLYQAKNNGRNQTVPNFSSGHSDSA